MSIHCPHNCQPSAEIFLGNSHPEDLHLIRITRLVNSALVLEISCLAVSFPWVSEFGKYFERETGHVIEANILKGKLVLWLSDNCVTLASHNQQKFRWFLYPQAVTHFLDQTQILNFWPTPRISKLTQWKVATDFQLLSPHCFCTSLMSLKI